MYYAGSVTLDSNGLVQVQVNGQWGHVCAMMGSPSGYIGRWTSNEALVVCRQMGLSTGYARSFYLGGYPSISYNVTTIITMSMVNCSGYEGQIQLCQYYNGYWSSGLLGSQCYSMAGKTLYISL